MKAVHFGAGKIGRGFIADLLHDTGYEIVFVDVNEKVNEELNKYHNYYLYVIEEDYRRKEIDKVSALSPITEEDKVVEAIVEADVVTTAVLADNFPKIAGTLAKGLKARLEAGKERVNVIPCENALFNGDLLLKELVKTEIASEDDFLKAAAFPNTAVDRMVFGTDKDGRDGIDIGKDHELAVEVNKLVQAKETCNIRSDSREDADIIGSLAAGETITRLRQLDNGWSEVRTSDGSGYIRSDLLTEEVTNTTE